MLGEKSGRFPDDLFEVRCHAFVGMTGSKGVAGPLDGYQAAHRGIEGVRECPGLFEWQTPDGGCIGYPRYKGADGVERFTQRLVEEAGVLLLPSSIYRSELGKTPEDRFRVGYGRTNMPEALDALRRFLDSRPGRQRSDSSCD